MFKSKFPELSSNANADNWRIVADKYGQEFIKAQIEWKKQSFSKDVFGGSIENFVKQHTGLVNDTDIKRAGIYLVDASTQYGSGGLIGAVKTNKFKGISNIDDVLNAFNKDEKDNVGKYFDRSLGESIASRKGLYGAFDMRLNYSKNAQFSSTPNNNLKFDKNPIGVDPNIVKLLQDAHTIALRQGIDFKVPSTGVLRDSAEQNLYFKKGNSKADGYNNISRHQRGQALDINILKGGEKAYSEVNKILQQLAKQRGIEVEWGGSWEKFYDPYHFQINNSLS